MHTCVLQGYSVLCGIIMACVGWAGGACEGWKESPSRSG
jgi:hypothetical protein